MAIHPALEPKRKSTGVVQAFITRSRAGVLRGCASLDDKTVFTGPPTRNREEAWIDANYYAELIRDAVRED